MSYGQPASLAKRGAYFFMAIRPKTLTASIAPVLVAIAYVYAASSQFSVPILISALSTFLSLQIAVNLFNDALDFKKGADTKDRLGPCRVTQSGLFSPGTVMLLGTLFIVLSFLTAIPLYLKGGWPIFLISCLSALAAYVYTGGPFPLAYHGLGELFVLIFFGPVSVVSIAYVELGEFSPEALLAGLQVGLLATVMIAINNLRDIEQDKIADKKTLATRLGMKASRALIALYLFLPFALGFFWPSFGYNIAFYLPLTLLPFSITLIRAIYRTAPSTEYNGYLARAALIHLLFGVYLSIGLLVYFYV
ncbi:1,4-dihydroxy-2-naphthoate octaprenyltransferase [Estrella lausannensis]|uniref:1,4-dihydroxy-2-naphthoate octaprenyltransferase n=1 Tax=Estrella lausannensis TaxID=483423 RepID=A0A0H5DR66_9BACT|nr:1,4-dihydroxy-2-naphthoate octaprenyltransferase [Estrella lausannensis]CRX38139.1 1,4-dihydroxy-2-naphthoateoctaprenyltransferase [Estrella lausannensis]